MDIDLARLLPARNGHFLLESGHHGSLWLDLERLFFRPEPIRQLTRELAARLSKHGVDMICAPLVEGAFVGLFVALELSLPFTYTERFVAAEGRGLYPSYYRLPGSLRAEVRGKRVAIVNDVINAGSAVRGTFFELEACEATPVVIASLAALGEWTSKFTAEKKLGLETLAFIPNEIWTPAECPLCAQGVALTRDQQG